MQGVPKAQAHAQREDGKLIVPLTIYVPRGVPAIQFTFTNPQMLKSIESNVASSPLYKVPCQGCVKYGWFLLLTFFSFFKAAPYECPVGFRIDATQDIVKCVPCNEVWNCASLTTCTTESNSQCDVCQKGFRLDNSGPMTMCHGCDNGGPQFNCAEGTYPGTWCPGTSNVDTQTCSPCPTPCTTCTSANVCTACKAGHYLKNGACTGTFLL